MNDIPPLPLRLADQPPGIVTAGDRVNDSFIETFSGRYFARAETGASSQETEEPIPNPKQIAELVIIKINSLTDFAPEEKEIMIKIIDRLLSSPDSDSAIKEITLWIRNIKKHRPEDFDLLKQTLDIAMQDFYEMKAKNESTDRDLPETVHATYKYGRKAGSLSNDNYIPHVLKKVMAQIIVINPDISNPWKHSVRSVITGQVYLLLVEQILAS